MVSKYYQKGFTFVESLVALAITSIVLLMVLASSTAVKATEERVNQRRTALLSIVSESETIRALHGHNIEEGTINGFFTGMPEKLAHPKGLIDVQKTGEEGCFKITLTLSWGEEKRERESLILILCR